MKLRFKFVAAFAVFCAFMPLLNAQQGGTQSYISEEAFFNEELESAPQISDPIEPVNRWIFKFNDFVYLKIVAPVADAYQAVTPDEVEEGAVNFFNNLQYPIRLTGNLLQARWEGALVESKRFVVNTTLGVGGVMRPADRMEGLAPIPPEDMGQAFGAWGIGEGPYLVLPLLGPSNLRDFAGMLGDRAVNPIAEPFSLIDHWSWENRLALGLSEFVVRSPFILERYRQMKGGAIDPYGSLKDAYTQYRRGEVAK